MPKKQGIDKTAAISASATVAEDVYIGAYAVIGDGAKIGSGCQVYPHAVIGDGVTLGEGCIIYPNVTIYQGCQLGNNVTIHAGSVIGADGFGFAPNAEGYDKIPQIGIVTIEDNVEIGANTCIDRSTMGSTIIRKGVKLDNLIQIAHNVEVGENTVMSAQVGVAGSTKVGEWCMLEDKGASPDISKLATRCSWAHNQECPAHWRATRRSSVRLPCRSCPISRAKPSSSACLRCTSN